MPFRRLIPLAAAVLLLAIAGCGSEGGDGSSPGGDSASGGSETEQVKVFTTEGEQFDPVQKEVPAGDLPKAATQALLDAPADRTYIPEGTEVKDVTVTGDGKATVKLSDEFLGDIPADPAERTRRENDAVEGRVAQVTYTLTSLKSVDQVKVESGGLAVTKTKDRADFSEPQKAPPLPGQGDQYGARASGATQLQQQLADLRYLPQSGVDGVIGYQTQQAVMAFQSVEGLTRDGVAGPVTKAALRVAKTPQPSARRPQRLMEVRIGKGVLLLVRGGKTVRVIHVSAGGPGNETPTGRYRIFRKELQSWSVPFSTWLPYASYFNNGIAFHEYPDVPPYPASHGCVRVPAPEAPLVYRFARLGTVVVVRS
ncbi:MAG TPA: L,D-transpeptidase family protein [Solirubrobacterales bacterium]|nr:L,D-transpeptidase family protein [Solirubrobacterales bacterium]HNF83955.1 L,D-transpeptidase family protein [Solirubrobacterales bacterium]